MVKFLSDRMGKVCNREIDDNRQRIDRICNPNIQIYIRRNLRPEKK